MGGRIKRFLLSFNRLNKPAVLAAGLFFIILGIIVPLHFAEASWLLSLFYKVIGIIFAAIFQILMAITWVPLVIANQLLLWVIGPNFITVPFTNNAIVNLGWDLVRDFVNIFFILVLAFIGLATALRIPGYEYKKALPLLIAVALLINFTPVICGLIIDASNIVMNFFLGSTGSALNSFAGKFISQTKLLWDLVGMGANPGVIIAQGILLVIFNVVVAFVFGCFTILFFCRYAILWLLVILSPLAFFCYILPATRKIWDMWWKQFIQWCIIGITGAFFLYLGEQMIALQGRIQQSEPTLPPDLSGFAGIVTSALPLIFLILGFLMSLQTGAMGGSAIIGFAKKATGKAGRAYFGAVGRGARAIVPAKVKAKVRGMAGWGAAVPGARGAIMRGLARPVGWAQRKAGLAVTPETIEAEMKDKELQGLVAKKDWKALAARYTVPGITDQRKIAIATLLAQNKGEEGLEKLDPAQREEAAKLAAAYSPKHMEDLTKASPALSQIDAVTNKMVDLTKPKDREEVDEIIDEEKISESEAVKRLAHIKAVRGMSGDDVKNLTYDTVTKDEQFKKDFVLNRDISDMVSIGEKLGQKPLDVLHAKAEELGPEMLAKKNARLFRASVTSPQNWAFPALVNPETKEPFERSEVDSFIRGVKEKKIAEEEARIRREEEREEQRRWTEGMAAEMEEEQRLKWEGMPLRQRIGEAWRASQEAGVDEMKIPPGRLPGVALKIGRIARWGRKRAEPLRKKIEDMRAERRREKEEPARKEMGELAGLTPKQRGKLVANPEESMRRRRVAYDILKTLGGREGRNIEEFVSPETRREFDRPYALANEIEKGGKELDGVEKDIHELEKKPPLELTGPQIEKLKELRAKREELSEKLRSLIEEEIGYANQIPAEYRKLLPYESNFKKIDFNELLGRRLEKDIAATESELTKLTDPQTGKFKGTALERPRFEELQGKKAELTSRLGELRGIRPPEVTEESTPPPATTPTP